MHESSRTGSSSLRQVRRLLNAIRLRAIRRSGKGADTKD